jgi:hypothetical protein
MVKKADGKSSVRISDSVKVQAKVYVATRKMMLSDLMDAAVLEYLKKRS